MPAARDELALRKTALAAQRFDPGGVYHGHEATIFASRREKS